MNAATLLLEARVPAARWRRCRAVAPRGLQRAPAAAARWGAPPTRAGLPAWLCPAPAQPFPARRRRLPSREASAVKAAKRRVREGSLDRRSERRG